MPDPAVCAQGFGYRYPDGDRPALERLSLELRAGSFTVVVGTSGAGKSTLLRALCGLVPHFHGGQVWGTLSVAGMDVREHGPGELAAACGTVFQDPETQVVMGGVRADIALPLEHRGEPPAVVARAVEEAALALGIAHLLGRRTETLSGGELQRVAIASALVNRPSVLVLDEPTSQLDPVAADELVWRLRRLNEEWGTTVVLAEHRLERCLPAADRVLALRAGAVAFDGPPPEFLGWAVEREEGLATPLARLFAQAGLTPASTSVKEARGKLAAAGLVAAGRASGPSPEPGSNGAGSLPFRRWRRDRGGGRERPAVALRGAWLELLDGPAVLRGIDLRLLGGERVALAGRNGAGKSTALRVLRGLVEPTRGTAERSGQVALLLQNPGDYLIRDRVVEEAGSAGVAAAGLTGREDASPKDLSGGQRQRLALEVALGGGPWAAVLLDEPTRGMDPVHKRALARRIEQLAEEGAAVMVATHDLEFAASFATRVVLMGEGVVIADGPPEEVLVGGWHFSTDVARVVGAPALTPEQGVLVLRKELVG